MTSMSDSSLPDTQERLLHSLLSPETTAGLVAFGTCLIFTGNMYMGLLMMLHHSPPIFNCNRKIKCGSCWGCFSHSCFTTNGCNKCQRLYTTHIFNPRCACAARVTVLWWPHSCVSVTTLVKASLGSTPRKRYVQHWFRLFSVSSLWIFKKTSTQKLWREKANMLMSI